MAEADGLPCADFGLLAPVKRSPEYRAIRAEVAHLKPLDAWRAGDVHYFTFGLRAEGQVALFAIRWEDDGPITSVVVAPAPERGRVEVTELRDGSVRLVDLDEAV